MGIKTPKEDLEDLEKYIEELSAFLPLAICTLSHLGVIIDINKAFEKLTGFNSLEIIGESLDKLFLEKTEIQKIIRDIKKEGIIEERELTIISKQKKKIPVAVSLSLRRNREGNFIGFFVGIADITQLKKSQEELEEKVKERTKELQERIEELEKFYRLTVGRELKMMELKKEIEKLQKELKKHKT